MSMPTKARSRGGDLIEAIRLKILLHELRPGDGISEDALAEEFGVSRTPIREAIITLQADRLVTLERNYGAYVAADSLGAFKSYLEAAILIQSQTLALAAKRRTERNLARLAEILEEAKAHQASEASIPRILACRQFMFELARASQNPLLAEQARRMIDLHIFFALGWLARLRRCNSIKSWSNRSMITIPCLSSSESGTMRECAPPSVDVSRPPAN